jgi:hypothetical protein
VTGALKKKSNSNCDRGTKKQIQIQTVAGALKTNSNSNFDRGANKGHEGMVTCV